MDTGLIFPDFYTMRRKDGVQYALLIIGFEFVPSEGNPGKSGFHHFKRYRNPAIRQRGFCKARFQEKFLSLIV